MNERSPAGQASNIQYLTNKLDRELNDLLKAVHEYRHTNKEGQDEEIIKKIIDLVAHGKRIVEDAESPFRGGVVHVYCPSGTPNPVVLDEAK